MKSKNIIFDLQQIRTLQEELMIYRWSFTIELYDIRHYTTLFGYPLIQLYDGHTLWWRGECDYCGMNEIDSVKCLCCGAPLDRMGKYFSSEINLENIKSVL